MKTFIASALLSASVAGAASTKSFVCNHPDKPGGWGALDLGCDADQFGDLARMKSIYSSVIFDRRIEDPAHESEYLTNISAVIREVAKQYYLARNPNPKAWTLEAWERAAVAVGAHESMLSHYRMAHDNRYKLMTGDHLVSHGVMQVNQEYHANKQLDSSFDLVGNIVASIDTYYKEWQNALKQQCYWQSNGKGNVGFMLENRARAAYSAYNGGSGNICRYTNPKSRYKRNDDGFYNNYHNMPWHKWVHDDKRASPVNVKCLMNGDDLCAMAKPTRDTYIKSRPLLFPNGLTCVTTDGVALTCASDMRLFSCLAKLDPAVLDNDPLKMSALPAGARVTVLKDREPLCKQAVKGLYSVGTMGYLNKEILMRETVGGTPIGNTRVGRIYQIQDYDLRLGGKTERYYKITTSGGSEGWIYGGSDDDFATWITVATPEQIAKLKADAEAAKAEKARAIAEAQAQAAAAQAAAAKEAAAKALAEAQRKAEEARKADEARRAQEEAAQQPDIVVTAPRRPTPTPTPAPAPIVVVAPPVITAPPIVKIDPAVLALADDEPQAVLPVKGSIVEIVKPDGIVLRATPGEDEDKAPIDQLYKGARLTVEEVQTLGTENKLYLKVTMGGKTGWIYSGRTFPDVTIGKWIKIWK